MGEDKKNGLLGNLLGDVNADVTMTVNIDQQSVFKIAGITLATGLILIILNKIADKIFN